MVCYKLERLGHNWALSFTDLKQRTTPRGRPDRLRRKLWRNVNPVDSGGDHESETHRQIVTAFRSRGRWCQRLWRDQTGEGQLPNLVSVGSVLPAVFVRDRQQVGRLETVTKRSEIPVVRVTSANLREGTLGVSARGEVDGSSLRSLCATRRRPGVAKVKGRVLAVHRRPPQGGTVGGVTRDLGEAKQAQCTAKVPEVEKQRWRTRGRHPW